MEPSTKDESNLCMIVTDVVHYNIKVERDERGVKKVIKKVVAVTARPFPETFSVHPR